MTDDTDDPFTPNGDDDHYRAASVELFTAAASSRKFDRSALVHAVLAVADELHRIAGPATEPTLTATDPPEDSGRENGAEPLTEEPPVGTQAVEVDGAEDLWQRFAEGWRWWMTDKWGPSLYSWAEITNDDSPLRLATDADRERVGLPREQWPNRGPMQGPSWAYGHWPEYVDGPNEIDGDLQPEPRTLGPDEIAVKVPRGIRAENRLAKTHKRKLVRYSTDFRGHRSHSVKDAETGAVVAHCGYGPDGGTAWADAEFIAAADPQTESKDMQAALEEALAPIVSEREELRAKVERVKALHRKIPVYELAEDCGHKAESHEIFETQNGDLLCADTPIGEFVCHECSEYREEAIDWPCSTIRALDGGSDE